MMETPDTLFDSIARLLPVADREHFFRRMAHLRDLSPNDDMLQIAEAMGFLALLIRQAPPEIASERAKLEALFQDTLAAIKLVNDSALAHRRDLEQRIENLPAAVALALNPQNVATLLCESLRQQFYETGLPALAETIASQTQTLRKTTSDFAKVFESFSDPECGATARVHRAMTCMHGDLNSAANRVRALTNALGKDLRRAIFLLCTGALVVGFFLGKFYCQ
jgi:hypothetical protein